MHNPKRRIVLTGLGVVSPIGIGKKVFREALLTGKSGTKRISSFEASTYPTQVAGEVRDFDPVDFIPHKEARRMDRSSQMTTSDSPSVSGVTAEPGRWTIYRIRTRSEWVESSPSCS